MGDGDRLGPRAAVAAGVSGALALGSLAVGASAPWLTGALAVTAVVVFGMARPRR
ncbi:hypothetical protein ACFFQW_23215 [Umezawaea endophytica]|uniref:Uncharacterized protein n=1 Tax=Umezawaea endophytica TaxID=1654476 RepID=A0A9X2VR78_9PSEU|nr:hypothetical protein [Umezawaea endophytica]MCS7481386.1 hypothetical protein [Umezawaea endophytica]